MKKRCILFCSLLLGALMVQAQSSSPSTINSSGGSASVGQNRYSWSIGEMTLVNTATGANIIVTQGLLQNNPLSTGLDKPETKVLAHVYPNPAGNSVALAVSIEGITELNYSLMDATGKTISTGNVQNPSLNASANLDFSKLAAGLYFLNLSAKTHEGEISNSIKIQKTN